MPTSTPTSTTPHQSHLFFLKKSIHTHTHTHTHTLMYLCIYLFISGWNGSLSLHRASSSCSQQGLLSGRGTRASHCSGFSYCCAQALGPLGFSSCGSWVLQHRLNSCGSQAPWHVGSSWIGNQTHVSCIGREILDYQRSPVVFFKI